MRKVALLFIAGFMSLAMAAAENEKVGFLTTKWCADNNMFKDCRTETNTCGYGECHKEWDVGDKFDRTYVLFVHEEGKYYTVDFSDIKAYQIDKGFARNEVKIYGDIDPKSAHIAATKMDPPPPPKKVFYKGCL